jgi:hypothetical protein
LTTLLAKAIKGFLKFLTLNAGTGELAGTKVIHVVFFS